MVALPEKPDAASGVVAPQAAPEVSFCLVFATGARSDPIAGPLITLFHFARMFVVLRREK